jgi:thiol-disulfide isomerase/thioredoxin
MTINYSISPRAILSGWLLLLLFAVSAAAQAPKLPVVKQINEVALKQLIKPNGKPLLVNFWATWCDPCRDEFPDLVKLDKEYKGKIDFITVSLDFPEDIATTVPKFLAMMKAEMPTYVLITPDETAAIGSVNKDWQGGLPFTILYDKDGKMSYVTQKVVKLDVIRPEIDKLVKPAEQSTNGVTSLQIVELPINPISFTFDQGVSEAKADLSKGEIKLLRYGLNQAIGEAVLMKLKETFGIKVSEKGCVIFAGYDQYAFGYNETVIAALVAKHGNGVRERLAFAPVRK